MVLRVDFNSPRRVATIPVTGHRREWGDALMPNAEPSIHDWLELRVPDVGAGTELELRVRTWLGGSVAELRLRDELELELRGPGLADTLDPAALSRSDTTLVAHKLEPGRARLQFRGQRAASREPAAAIDDVELGAIVLGTVKLILRRFMPESFRSWDYASRDALLTGPVVLEHLELSRTVLGVRSSRAARA